MLECYSFGSSCRKLSCALLLLFASTLPAFAELPASKESEIDRRHSIHYYGMHLDWDLNMDFDEPLRSFISNRYLGAGVSYGYGRYFFRPRARVSAGWRWGAGFALSMGVEIPLIEILTESQLKMFGLYVTGDYGYAFGSDGGGFYRISPYLRLPVTPLAGVMLGASYSSESAWSVFIGRSIGGYPLKKKEQIP